MYSGDEFYGDDVTSPLFRPQNPVRKTFTVDSTATNKTTIIVRTGCCRVARFEYHTKTQADKKVLALIAEGYTFDDQRPTEPHP